MDVPVTSQPQSGVGQAPGEGPGPVQVQPATLDDAEFAGTMLIEAFHDKFRTAVGERNMDAITKGSIEAHRIMEPEYHRLLVAKYEGQRAGVIELAFHNTTTPDGLLGAYTRHLSCCGKCGFCCMSILMDHTSKVDECYVSHICCDSNFRGKGVGKILLDRAEWEARKRGCRRMTLAVTTTNRARNLYERQGYVVKDTEDGMCCTYLTIGIRKFYMMEKQL